MSEIKRPKFFASNVEDIFLFQKSLSFLLNVYYLTHITSLQKITHSIKTLLLNG